MLPIKHLGKYQELNRKIIVHENSVILPSGFALGLLSQDWVRGLFIQVSLKAKT